MDNQYQIRYNNRKKIIKIRKMQVKVNIKDTIIIINNMSRCITLEEILLCLSVCPGHSVLEQIQETWYDTVSRLVWLQSEGIGDFSVPPCAFTRGY